MAWYLYPVIVAAGFLAGFINTLAGSGSLVSLPALIFAGLPANVANGTNRIAILLQNVVGVRGFRSHGLLDLHQAVLLAVPAAVGAIVGAHIAVGLDEAVMRRTIGVIMLFTLLVIVGNPRRWIQGRPDQVRARPDAKEIFLFFLMGGYGGFIQAGVGIFLLAGLVLGAGFDLVRANAIKVFIVLFFTVPALVIFVMNHQVNWGFGLLLAIGNMSGAWAGTRVAASPGAAVWVHRLLVAVVLYSAIHLLGWL